MKHCKKYETHNDYIVAKNIGLLVKHNVSYCQDNKDVHYDPDYDQYYSTKYLSFEAIDSGTFTFRMSQKLPTTAVPYISYSVDGGETWVKTNNIDNQEVTVTTPVINKGAVVIWKSEAVQYIYNTNNSAPTINNGFGRFSSNGRFNVYGNIMSLMYGDDFENKTILKNILDNCYYSGSFGGIFYNNSGLVSASNLILPATTLNAYCYYSMFQNCSSLTAAPKLPATTLADYCYYYMFNNCKLLTTTPELPATTLAGSCYRGMFQGCTSLTTAPVLPVTTLMSHCYDGMFWGCTSLTEAPELPATTLTSSCYHYMFSGCTSLTEAPVLPATTLADTCYSSMFWGCTSLTTAPELPATTLVTNCYSQMFYGCTSLTTAPELPATTLAYGCYSNMFHGCTSLATAPELPATTLTQYCYNSMFYGCTNLTTAPSELPATTLVTNCYSSMFNGCSNLNYIKAMFITEPSTSYTNNWVTGVSSTGTFVKNTAATWDVTGSNGIPSNWTVQTATA